MAAKRDHFTAPELDASALVTIDVQADFLDGGPAAIAGTTAILPTLAELIADFRAVRRPIVHVVRLYEADGSNADLCRRALIEAGTELVRPDSEGSQLPQRMVGGDVRLDPARLLAGALQPVGPGEHILYKPRWSAFFATGLDEHLAALGVSTLVVAGCNYPNCPRATIYDASARDYRLVLVSDATSGFDGRAADEMRAIGVSCLTAAELRERWPARA